MSRAWLASAWICFTRPLTAFVNEDVETAKSIPVKDDEVDAPYNQVYRELMTVIQDPKTIERANWLLWVAHNLERVADRVTNICERTIFIATGEMEEIKSTDDEFWQAQRQHKLKSVPLMAGRIFIVPPPGTALRHL